MSALLLDKRPKGVAHSDSSYLPILRYVGGFRLCSFASLISRRPALARCLCGPTWQPKVSSRSFLPSPTDTDGKERKAAKRKLPHDLV